MMKSAENRLRGDVTDPSNRTAKRCVLGQSEMRPDMVVVGSISLKDPAQMVLAQDYDVVQAVPTENPIHTVLCIEMSLAVLSQLDASRSGFAVQVAGEP